MNEETHMNHGMAILFKAVLTFLVLWIVLSAIYNVSFLHSTFIGIVLLLVSYVAGDMMILPKMGNMAATTGDLVIGFLIIWGGLLLFGYGNSFGEALLTGVVIAIGEYLFHSWLLRTQYTNRHV
ncbi:cation transport ATPase [Sporosarcina luteola]|nr:cation transport ATPase [Sporosarcina luteola]